MNPSNPLDENDLNAIDLKFRGFSYQEIAKKTGLSVSTIKSWFMRSGRLYKPYTEYAVSETREVRERATRLYASALEKAVKTMNHLLNSDDERIRFITAKEIIKQATLEAEPITPEEVWEIKMADIMLAVKKFREEETQKKELVGTTG